MTSAPGEMWDRRFAEQAWPTDPDPYLVELADQLPLGRGLDLGSGPGRNSLWLALKGWEMTLVDASRVGLEQAAAAARSRSAEIATVVADLLAWDPAEGQYDLAIVANVHPGPDDLALVLDTAARSLRSGGHIYVVGHHVSNLGRHGPPDPSRLLTEERLRAALPGYLRLETLETRDRSEHAAGIGGDSAPDAVVIAWATK